ncbi:hypothetical protein FSARC_2970 [Fusarium sarcochroum]|uniref:F-box domain-containing protein n=1 Tax=Fusarium sarcochroum TaxID=1208366 RepID=A0A8H4XD10_9HYPO|nr:hypothetical protein FSARC_2970 [Fusarium sarcochroum]
MSNYECYCAICSCPLASSSITVGRSSGPCSSGSQTDNTSNDDSDSDVDEAYEYDPSVVKKTELGWLKKFRCLGFNENCADLGAGFVSGPSKYLDDEEVVATQSVDPNAPEDTKFSCYRDDSFDGLTRVFPIHDACFSILTRALTGSIDNDLLKKDILYEVMERLVSSNSALDIDYGGIAGPEQFWVSARGEEYVVANPVERKPTFEKEIRRHAARIVALSPNDHSTYDLRSAVPTKTLFLLLPPEILMKIGLHLPTRSIASFALLSRSCAEIVRMDAFWKKHLLWQMNWAWEADIAVGTAIEDRTSFREACLWLDHVSLPPRNQISEYLGVINRRRIWNTCEQIAGHYFALIDQAEIPPRDHDRAESVDTKETIMMYAHPECNTERLVWVQSWDELNGASATAEAVWNSDGILIGLGMILRRKRSFAGKTEDQVMNSDRETCRISTRPWIKGMIAHMDQAGAGVRGLTFMGCDGYSHTVLGNIASSLHRLALVPKNGCGIIGLTLQLAAGGEILGLRAIQSPKPDDDPIMNREADERPSYCPSLWSCRTGRLEIVDFEMAPTRAVPHEIQSMRLIPLTDNMKNDEEQLVTDLLPHEILLWNQDQIEGTALRAVSFYTPKAETGNERIIRGLRANFARGHSTRKKLVGDFEFGKWGAPLELWPEEDLVTLKVDGSNGETISQVAISPVTHPQAMKITTNLGNTVTAGNRYGNDWSVFGIATGQELAGLCLAFEPVNHSIRQGAMSSLLAVVRNA